MTRRAAFRSMTSCRASYDHEKGSMKLPPFALVAALASGPALAADFSGTWNISSKVGDNPVSIVCTLAQKGDALTGTCKPAQFEPSDTKGTVSGQNAKWGYDVVFNGNQNHVEYEA